MLTSGFGHEHCSSGRGPEPARDPAGYWRLTWSMTPASHLERKEPGTRVRIPAAAPHLKCWPSWSPNDCKSCAATSDEGAGLVNTLGKSKKHQARRFAGLKLEALNLAGIVLFAVGGVLFLDTLQAEVRNATTLYGSMVWFDLGTLIGFVSFLLMGLGLYYTLKSRP